MENECLNQLSRKEDFNLRILREAIIFKDLENVRDSLAKGAHINGCDWDGWTPLHIAASEGLTAHVELMLDTPDADFNAQNVDGNTPLHLASLKGNLELVEELENIKGKSKLIMRSKPTAPCHSTK